jgi:hypothetical protein
MTIAGVGVSHTSCAPRLESMSRENLAGLSSGPLPSTATVPPPGSNLFATSA